MMIIRSRLVAHVLACGTAACTSSFRKVVRFGSFETESESGVLKLRILHGRTVGIRSEAIAEQTVSYRSDLTDLCWG